MVTGIPAGWAASPGLWTTLEGGRTSGRTGRRRRSVRGPAAVQGQRGTGDEGCLRSAEIGHCFGDLVRFDEPLECRVLEEHLGEHMLLGDAVCRRLVGDLPLHQGR